MSEFENPDPRDEYIRICPYCVEEFIAGHMNRLFCPEKNGIINFCKNRWKRIARLGKQVVPIVEVEKSFGTVQKKELLVQEVVKNIQPSSVTLYTPLVGNISIMGATLGQFHHLKLPIDYLTDMGAVYEAFDNQYKLPGTELFGATYGPYAVVWGYEKHIVLTNKTNIPWMQ